MRMPNLSYLPEELVTALREYLLPFPLEAVTVEVHGVDRVVVEDDEDYSSVNYHLKTVFLDRQLNELATKDKIIEDDVVTVVGDPSQLFITLKLLVASNSNTICNVEMWSPITSFIVQLLSIKKIIQRTSRVISGAAVNLIIPSMLTSIINSTSFKDDSDLYISVLTTIFGEGWQVCTPQDIVEMISMGIIESKNSPNDKLSENREIAISLSTEDNQILFITNKKIRQYFINSEHRKSD